MNEEYDSGPVCIRQTDDEALAKSYGLTLVAMDIKAVIASRDGGFGIFVAPGDVLRAGWELDQYDMENQTSEQKSRSARAHSANTVSFVTTALGYGAMLAFFFGVARRGSFGLDWAGEGAMVSYHVITDLEIWRTVTALTLHLDPAHLASNLFFGIVFVYLLAKESGPGIAWVSTVFAGAAGNFLNAVWQGPVHTSIGASTAVFGAVGVMAALRHKWRPPEFSLRYWSPLGGGLMLMAFLGFGGGNTDIGAHVFGFFAGIVVGWWLSRKDKAWFGDEARQANALKLTILAVAGAWALALMV